MSDLAAIRERAQRHDDAIESVRWPTAAVLAARRGAGRPVERQRGDDLRDPARASAVQGVRPRLRPGILSGALPGSAR